MVEDTKEWERIQRNGRGKIKALYAAIEQELTIL